MTGTPDPIAVALLVADAFETLGLRYTVGGSLASSMSGEPRSTLDVDIVAAIQEAVPDSGPAKSPASSARRHG